MVGLDSLEVEFSGVRHLPSVLFVKPAMMLV
jgi:hypothetical protein